MAKQVIEPQIVEQNQIADRQESKQNSRSNFRFYHTQNSGCLGLVIFAFLTIFVVLPALIFGSLIKKRK